MQGLQNKVDSFQSNIKAKQWKWLTPYNSSIASFFIMLFFFKPEYFGEIPWLSRTFQLLLVCVAMYNIILYLLTERVTWFQVSLVAFYLVILFSTWRHNGDVMLILKSMVKASGIVCMILLGTKQNAKKFLRGIVPVFELWVCVNFIVYLRNPGGIFNSEIRNVMYHFLGHHNAMFKFAFPGLIFSLMYAYCTKSKLAIVRTVLLAAVAGMTVFKVWSVTSIIGYTIFIVGVAYVLLLRGRKPVKLVNFAVINTVCLSVFVGVVLLGMQVYFPWLIENVFKKQMDLSFRTEIWERARGFIAQKPILGWGMQPLPIRFEAVGYHWMSFHCLFMDVLHDGGFVALALLFLTVFFMWKSAAPYKREIPYRLLMVAYCAFFMMSLFESYVVDIFFYPLMLLTLLHNVGYIVAFDKSEQALRAGVPAAPTPTEAPAIEENTAR